MREHGESGIPEYLESHLNRGGAWMPAFFHVQYDEKSDSLFFFDQGGFIPTEEEFWSVVDLLARAYRGDNEERIRSHNRARRDESVGRDRSVPRSREKTSRRPQPGYVYLLHGAGSYKIGRAKDPTRRAETLKIQLPFEVELLCAVFDEDHKRLEAELHERFSAKRMNGEWFDLSPEDVAYIVGLSE